MAARDTTVGIGPDRGTVVAPALPDLRAAHPGLALRFEAVDALADLNRREADVALRIQTAPEPDLFGRRIGPVHVAAYRPDGMVVPDGPVPVIGWAAPGIVRRSFAALGLPKVDIVATTPDIAAQAALGHAAGAAMELPCYVGDAAPGLVRIGERTRPLADLWCLTHPDLRESRRVRAAFDWLTRALVARRVDLAGDRS